MIYLILGEDTYGSHTKLSAMKQEFIAVHGIDNLVTKNSRELVNVNLENVLFAQTLLGGNRLVVFENVLYESNDEARKNFIKILKDELPKDLDIVFYETNKVDRRLSLFKLLNKPESMIEFVLPVGIDRVNRVKTMMVEKQVVLSDSQLFSLIERTNNLWQIHNELDKISAFSMGKLITDEQFGYLVSGNADADTFALLDAIAISDVQTANRILNKALMQGENEIRMLGSIAYQLRNLIRIKDISESGVNPNMISRQIGVHPFVVKKTLLQVRQIKRARIVNAYQKLIKADWQIKTGAHKAPDAIDLLVTELAT